MKAIFNTGKNMKPLISLMLALGGLFAPFAISSHAADRVPDQSRAAVRADGDTKPENTRGFATELATYLACTLIQGGITDVLTDINQADGNDPVTGFLIQLLAGPPSPDAAALTNIQNSINAVQGQLTQLQASFGAFEASASNAFTIIEQEVTESTYDEVVQPLNNYNATLKGLSLKYNAIRSTYYTAGVPATHDPIDPVEQIQITAFMNAVASANLPDMFNGITGITHPLTGDSLYDVAQSSLELNVPFEHQVYPGMYNIFNAVTSMRATALNLYKEYQSYLWQTTPSLQIVTLDQYLTAGGYQDAYQAVITELNYDVANNTLLSKMNTLLKSAGAADKASANYPYDYFTKQISQTFTFEYNTTGDVYQVISNADHQHYVIAKQSAALELMAESQYSPNINTYMIAFGSGNSTGRFQPARTTVDIIGLLTRNTGNNPLQYLMDAGGLTGLDPDTDGIVLTSTSPVTKTESKTTVNASELFLLNANNYSANGDQTSCYLKLPGATTNVTSEDAFKGTLYNFGINDPSKALNAATFLSIYYDTHISLTPTVQVDPVTSAVSYVYTPTNKTAVTGAFCLDTGDVLDLSQLSGTLNSTITIAGDATIKGGGANNVLSGLKIQSTGANLTITDLYVTAGADCVFGNSGSFGPGSTLTVNGTCSLTSSGGNGVIYLPQALTITGPGSLTVTNTASAPAIRGGYLTVSNLANLTVISDLGPTTFSCSPTFSNCKVTSTVPTGQSGPGACNEFATAPSFTNSTLNLTYGPLGASAQLNNTTVNYIDVCTVVTVTTGNVKGAGTSSKIYFSAVYNGGVQSPGVRIDDIAAPGGSFQQGGTAVVTVNLGPVAQVGPITEFDGFILATDQSGSNPNWFLESLSYTLGSLQVSESPQMWFKDVNGKLFGTTATKTGEFEVTVVTANKSDAGTDANITLTISGANGWTEGENMKNIPTNVPVGSNYDPFEKGATDNFNMGFADPTVGGRFLGLGSAPQSISLEIDNVGSGPDWYCSYVEISPFVNGAATSKYTFQINQKLVPNTPVQGAPASSAQIFTPVERSPKWFPYVDFYHLPGYDNKAQHQVEFYRGSTRILAAVIRQRCFVESLDYLNAGLQGLLPGIYSVKVAKLVGDGYVILDTLPLTVPDYGVASVASVVADPTEEQGTYTFNFDLVNASGYDLEIKRNGTTVQSFTATFRPDVNGVLWPNQTVAKGGVVLSEPGDYEWTVRPFNPLTAAGSPSTSSRFTVATALQPTADFQVTPADYANLLPAGTAGTTVNGVLPVTFTWDAVSGAQDYFLYVTTTGGEVVLNRVKVEANTAYGPVNLAAGNYCWNLIAANATGVATWSPAVNFLIRTDVLENTTTPVISQLQPMDDAEIAHTPTQMEFLITWDVAGDQQELWLYREDSGEIFTATSAVVLRPLTKTSVFTVTAANFLAPGTYYWQVRGLHGTVEGQWSAARYYTILPATMDVGKPLLAATHGGDLTVEFPAGTLVPTEIEFEVQAKVNGAFRALIVAPAVGALSATIHWPDWVAMNAGLGTSKAIIFVRTRGSVGGTTGPWSAWATYTNP